MPFELLIASVIIIICVLLNKITNKIGMPMLLAFILLGMAFGTDGIFGIQFDNYHLSEEVCSVALIFIIFYGGFSTNWREAKPIARKAVSLSTLGVVLTAGFVGLFCYYALKISLWESLLIGAIISSTDAASVFSILRSKKLGLRENTASMLEIESGSNDTFSYTLMAIILSIIGGHANGFDIIYLVFSQMVYGVIFGAVIAFATKMFLKRFQFASAGFDMAFFLGIAVLSYALPTWIGGNGYMSAYIVGIVLGNTKISNKGSLVNFFDGFTSLMQMLIFFLLGLLATPSRIPEIMIPAISIALFLTFIARPVTVFAILSPVKCSFRQKVLVSFAGLRGAASIVFAIMATVNEATTRNDVFHIVFCIVLLSIAVQGTLLASVARKLGMCDNNINVLKTFSDYSEGADLNFIKLALPDDHPWIGNVIQDITMIPDTLIVMLIRNGKYIIPSGKTVLKKGDLAVISARAFDDTKGISLREKIIEAGSPWIDKPISEYSPTAGELVIMILRDDDETIVPKGDTLLQEGDILVINEAEIQEETLTE